MGDIFIVWVVPILLTLAMGLMALMVFDEVQDRKFSRRRK